MSDALTDLERRRAIDTAASMYLAEEPLDMSLLAERLGVGRCDAATAGSATATNCSETVLAEATERTYRKAMSQASGQVRSTFSTSSAALCDRWNRRQNCAR